MLLKQHSKGVSPVSGKTQEGCCLPHTEEIKAHNTGTGRSLGSKQGGSHCMGMALHCTSLTAKGTRYS